MSANDWKDLFGIVTFIGLPFSFFVGYTYGWCANVRSWKNWERIKAMGQNNPEDAQHASRKGGAGG